MKKMHIIDNRKYDDIFGLHEIHVTVDPTQLHKMKLFCQEHKYKLIYHCSDRGIEQNQLMMSKWKNGTAIQAIERAHKIAGDMRNYGLTVLRIKVEGLSTNKNIPHLINEDDDSYFEYHMDYNFSTIEEYQKLIELIVKLGGGYTVSALKPEMTKLVVTLRMCSSMGLIEAEKKKDNFIAEMKCNNFFNHGKIQKEFTVYDDNFDYDSGWIEGDKMRL